MMHEDKAKRLPVNLRVLTLLVFVNSFEQSQVTFSSSQSLQSQLVQTLGRKKSEHPLISVAQGLRRRYNLFFCLP